MHHRMIGAVLGAAALLAAAATGPALAADPPLPPGGAAILGWTPEQQAFGYRNMEKIGPTRVIARGEAVHDLPMAPVQIDPRFGAEGKTYDTAAYMAAFRASGVLVIKDGKILSVGPAAAIPDGAQVIDVSKLSGKSVMFGATVSLVDEDTEEAIRYQIVGEHEADVRQGRISVSSPLARAMIGKQVGDVFEVNTPGGVKAYEITKVEWV